MLGQWGGSAEEDDGGKEVGRGAVDADRTSGLANELVALSVVAELMTWSQHNDDDKHVIGRHITVHPSNDTT